MANPIAVPGTNVPSGAAVSPGGAQGATGTAGAPAWTTNTSGFTIPAVGSTVSVTVADASWIVVGEMLYVDQAGGGVGLSGVLQVSAKAGNTLTLLNPQPAPAIPLASSAGAGLLARTSGNTTDFIDGTNASQNLATAVQPTIWSARLRSFNAVGNPTFEVDQRSCGASGNWLTTGAVQQDRWVTSKITSGAMAGTVQQVAGLVNLPGTNFCITRNFLRLSLSTQQVSLSAGDLLWINQTIEGPQLRELVGDVHSFSILVRSSVANLNFGIAIRDKPAAPTRSLTTLCNIPSANSWTLITKPNIPVWSAGGFWDTTPGNPGYTISITLASGSTYTAPANDTWQTGNFVGAVGQSNFAAQAVNSTFDIAFVQHEPGAQCTTPMDCPFTQNYDDCLRYFQKSYPYGTAVGSAGQNTFATFNSPTAVNNAAFPVYGGTRFYKPMAKTPTCTAYNHSSGAINNAFLWYATSGTLPNLNIGQAISSVSSTQNGIVALNCATGNSTAPPVAYAEWTADTGW
jgi:hypothetical protein